jgi:hypothetical protein
MPTTGKVNGTLLKIYLGGVAVSYTTSASLEFSMATRSTTSKDSAGWDEKAEGLRTGTISGDFLFAFDATFGFDDLFALYNGRTSVAVKYSSNVAGDKRYEGTAYLTSLSQSSPMEDTISGSFTLEFTGVITEVANT